MTVPFTLWSTLDDFYFTSTGDVNNDYWGVSSITDGGTPIWTETETPTAGYAPRTAGNYSIVLTTQDWIGTEQPLVTVATDTGIIDPFGTSSSSIGNLGAATIFSSTSTTGVGAVIYWQTSSTVTGDYQIDFQPITVTYPTAPNPTGQNTVLTGSVKTLISAIAKPLSWSFVTNGTSSTPATSGVFYYTTYNTSTTENLYIEGFSTSGAPLTSSPVELAANIQNGAIFTFSYNSGLAEFLYDYTQVSGSTTGFYYRSLNPSTGALSSASEYLDLPNYTSILTDSGSNTLSSGTKLRFVEGLIGTTNVIQDFLGTGSTGAIATFNISGSTGVRWQIVDVYDPADGALDYTALAYTNNNQVHLELLGANGVQIGSDLIVPNLTSFDQIHTLSSSATANANSRIEIDYTATDPSGGNEIEGLIYDTATGGSTYTLGVAGDNEYNGTPFDDTISYAAGVYTVDGGGGTDTFVATNFAPAQVTVRIDALGEVVLSDGLGDVDTLQHFSFIDLANATIAINGNVLTGSNSVDGTHKVATFNIAGQAFVRDVAYYNSSSQLTSEIFYNADGSTYFTYSGPVSVSTFDTYQGALDLVPGGFEISDSPAAVSGAFDALNADSHLASITLTSNGTALLPLTVEQALNDTAALHAISNSYYHIFVEDTAANLHTVTGPQILTFAEEGVETLVATDASASYGFKTSAAIQADNISVSAPANDFVRLSLSSTTGVVYDFNAADALYKRVTTIADGTFDDYYLNVAGVFNGLNYLSYDAGFTAKGVRDSVAYYASTGINSMGQELAARTVHANGSFDVHYFQTSATFSGVVYPSYDVAFTAAGSRYAATYYASTGPGALEMASQVVNPDGSIENSFYNQSGANPSYQNDLPKSGSQLAHSFENAGGASGQVNIQGSNLVINPNTGNLGPSGAPNDFSFNLYPTENYAFLSGTNDTINFSAGFGAAVIKDFATASATDVLNLSSLFSNLSQAQGAMSNVNGNTVITDGTAGDLLTINGVLPGAFTAARLGLSS